MDLEFLLDASLKYKYKKIEIILGTFRIRSGTKTKEFSMIYEGEKTIFNFFDDYLELTDPQYKKNFSLIKMINYPKRGKSI